MFGLPLPFHGVVLVATVALGLLEARRVQRAGVRELRHAGQRVRYLYALLPILLLCLVGLFLMQTMRDLWWRLPLLVEYSFLPLVWGAILGCFGFLFSLVCGLAWRLGDPTRRRLVVASLLMVVAAEVAHWQYARLAAPGLRHLATSDGVVLQSSDATCAAASAANLLRLSGVQATERQLAVRFGSSVLFGTSIAQVVFGLRELGYDCRRFAEDPSSESSPPLPALLLVDHPAVGEEGHLVLATRRQGQRLEVLDPLTGRRELSRSELRRRWHGRGLHCEARTDRRAAPR